MSGSLTQQGRVDLAITPEFVEHGTIEEERVEFVSALDVISEWTQTHQPTVCHHRGDIQGGIPALC